MGAAVNALPGGEIVPAMDRGLLDAAEFNNMTSDRALGFPDVSKVCMLQSFHQNAEQFEIMFNKTKYDALPDEAAGDHRQRRGRRLAPTWRGRRSTATPRTTSSCRPRTRCSFYKTPDSVLQQQLEVYDQVVAKKSAENPLFKEIVDSQKAFAERAVKWDMDNNVNRRMAYNHYFGQKRRPAPRRRRPDAHGTRAGTTRPTRVVLFLSAVGEPMTTPDASCTLADSQHVGRQGRRVADRRC